MRAVTTPFAHHDSIIHAAAQMRMASDANINLEPFRRVVTRRHDSVRKLVTIRPHPRNEDMNVSVWPSASLERTSNYKHDQVNSLIWSPMSIRSRLLSSSSFSGTNIPLTTFSFPLHESYARPTRVINRSQYLNTMCCEECDDRDHCCCGVGLVGSFLMTLVIMATNVVDMIKEKIQ